MKLSVVFPVLCALDVPVPTLVLSASLHVVQRVRDTATSTDALAPKDNN